MSNGSQLCFDRIAERYDETRGGVERGARTAGDLWAHLRTDRRVLELGIGTGVVALGMQRIGFPVYGVDLSMEMLARARARIGPFVTAGDAARLPIGDASFEQAYSVYVMHLVAEPEAVMAEIARILTPGGHYVDVRGTVHRTEDVISETMRPMIEEIAAGAWGAAAEPEGLVELAVRAGFRLVEARDGRPSVWLDTPARAASMIEDRVWSFLWNVDEGSWEKVVQPTIDALRAMPPDPVERRAADRILAFAR